MKFENVGKWMKETEEDKLVFDNREPADYLNGDDEICTLKTEDDESDYDDDFSGELLDEVESEDFEDELDSPENEEDAIIMADESSQQNEALNSFSDYKRFYKDLKEFRKDMSNSFPGDKRDLLSKIDDIMYVIKVMFDGEKLESSQKNEDSLSKKDIELIENWVWSNVNTNSSLNGQFIDIMKYPQKLNGEKVKKYLAKHISSNNKKPVDTAILVNAIAVGLDKEPDISYESAQKNEGPEELKTDKYKEDFFEYKNGGHGSFMEYLAKACMLADKKNLAKIQKEFPELTKSFCLWKSSGRTDKVEKL